MRSYPHNSPEAMARIVSMCIMADSDIDASEFSELQPAFYEAIARADLAALMSVWADDEEIVCIHPTGQRLTGTDAIRDSWRGIFANNPRLMVRLSRGVRWSGMLLAVHNVVETLYIGDERRPYGPMLAINVFQRGASGWRLLSHHSSTAADRDAADTGVAGERNANTPRTLH